MTMKKWKTWFAVLLMTTLMFSASNLIAGNYWSAYIEQDPEHNFVSWMGVDYGVGMGSASFCSRCTAVGSVGIIASIAEVLIFPRYMRMHFEDEEGC